MTFVTIFFLFFLEGMLTEENPNKKFKLSDLPVLKKWEIPNHHFSRRVGRKYKDLDRDMKRSAYWELKPDFTANELEWDEDPEKVRLDFNYKGFFEDDEEDVKGELATGEKRTLSVHDGLNTKHSTRKNNNKSNTGQRSNRKSKSKSRKKKTRSKRSIVEEQDGEEREVNFVPNPFFIENIEDGDEYDNEIQNKRAAIWNVVRQLEMSDGNLENLNKRADENKIVRRHVTGQGPIVKRQQQMKHAAVNYPTPLIIPRKGIRSSVPTNPEEKKKSLPNEATTINRRNKIMSTKEAESTIRNVHNARNDIENHKKQKAGELGDEQMKRNKERIGKEPSVKSTRQNIGRPDLNVDPANVARAVTMAMEQLKRDKMWGKVFVHVRPSGQLKVMVQETKRMDETV